METFLAIIFIVFGILQIILFFKLWGMTNDIRDIKEKYLYRDEPVIINEDALTENYSDGLLVVELKTEKQMRLGDQLKNGKYKCYSNHVYVGDFAPSEFMELNKWSKEVYKK